MFDNVAIRKFELHAEECFPNEACGFIADGEFYPCKNEADNPRRDFHIRSEEYVRLFEEGKTVECVMHSHTPPVLPHREGETSSACPYPTVPDQRNQRLTRIAWGITVMTDDGQVQETFFFGDEAPMVPLISRPFKHAVWDCYSLVRDFFRERGTILFTKERENEWWEHGEQIYTKENWVHAGFREVRPDQVRFGDCFLMKIRSEVPNHSGVYIGNDLIMHHLMHRLSCKDTVSKWMPKIECWLRHESMEDKADVA